MTHPHQLHAHAAAESLRAALVSCGHRAHRERYGWAAVGDGLRSWAPGVGRGAGGHGDPVATEITGTVTTRHHRRAEWTMATLAWLAGRLSLPTEAPLDAIVLALPHLQPPTIHQLTLWLRDLDRRCRDDLSMGDGLWRSGAELCPACAVWRWKAPGNFVLCLNPICLCAGDPCACTMPVKAPGVQHIWSRT